MSDMANKKKTDPLLSPAARKFLFDRNDFDDHAPKPEDDAPPPPPTFSEEELAAARDEAYSKGRKDGLAEAEASREKHVSSLIQTIAKNFETLFASETMRAAQFEGESLHLAQAIFSQLFPALNERHGLEELQKAIFSVLENHRERPDIIVEVNPDYVTDIQEQMVRALKYTQTAGNATVRGNHVLKPGQCKLSWKDGGAARDPLEQAREIERKLNHVLADKPRLRDNEKSGVTPPETKSDKEQNPEKDNNNG